MIKMAEAIKSILHVISWYKGKYPISKREINQNICCQKHREAKPARVKKMSLRLLAGFMSFLMVLGGFGSMAFAWEQEAHQIINQEAIRQFNQMAATADKYRNSRVDLGTMVEAPFVTSTSRTSYYYEQEWRRLSGSLFIVHGGYSSDEPHLYVSVKHFYDPLNETSPQLTDLAEYHGLMYEAIPATDWALTHTDNPYSLVNAMKNYKMSMEIPSNAQVRAIPATADFRDFAGQPESVEQMRAMYLGKAMRGIGEVMHLVGDMMQPAHVRNDAHPKWEITESAVTEDVAWTVIREPRRDRVNLAAAGNDIFAIMHAMAKWTNENFYSEDTMYDPVYDVKPRNGHREYPSPVFSNFIETMYDGYPTWVTRFQDLEVKMFREETTWVTGRKSYIITSEFAVEQSKVLLPLAAAGCARVIDAFMPTLTLKQDIVEVEPDAELVKIAEELGVLQVRQFEPEIKLEHQISQDTHWEAHGLEIRYSGPGELWKISSSKEQKIADVEFLDGAVARYQDPVTGEMVDGKPQLIMPMGAPSRVSLSGPEIDYTVESDDAVFARISAGARNIKCDPFFFEEEDSEIKLKTESLQVMPGERTEFEVEIKNPPGRYTLEWHFGDEDPEDPSSFEPVRSRSLSRTHAFDKEQDYTVTVRLIDTRHDVVRAEDSLTITAEFGDLSGSWDIILTVEEESTFFRNMIVMLMKVIIRIFISPLAEALGEGPVDESVADSFTFVGSTIEYKTYLSEMEDYEVAYQGSLEFTGSNTGYFSPPADNLSTVLVLEDGYLVFYAGGYDEYGNFVEFKYLTHGKMHSTSHLEGRFDMPGQISGTWVARR